MRKLVFLEERGGDSRVRCVVVQPYAKRLGCVYAADTLTRVLRLRFSGFTDRLWPAIWLLPENNDYGLWPASGEIDIMVSGDSDER